MWPAGVASHDKFILEVNVVFVLRLGNSNPIQTKVVSR
jgi:hypothetical protein